MDPLINPDPLSQAVHTPGPAPRMTPMMEFPVSDGTAHAAANSDSQMIRQVRNGYFQQNPQPSWEGARTPRLGIPTNGPSQSFGSKYGSALVSSGMGMASEAIGGAFNLGASFVTAAAQRDVANTNKEASNYFADNQLTGLKYNADNDWRMQTRTLNQQKEMWNRDYDIANQYGLLHPAQLTGAINGTPMTSDTYTLGNRGLSRQPRTFKKSPFAY